MGPTYTITVERSGIVIMTTWDKKTLRMEAGQARDVSKALIAAADFVDGVPRTFTPIKIGE